MANRIVKTGGIGGTATEITDNVITFTSLKSWVNSTLSSLTVDLTGAVEGARTVVQFISETNPEFSELENIDFVSGSWLQNTNLLLQFEYFQGKVYLVIANLGTALAPPVLAKLSMLLNSALVGTLTTDSNNLVSEFADSDDNANNFTATGTKRPLLKRTGVLFDGVDNILEKAVTSYGFDSQGEIMILVAPREQNFKAVFTRSSITTSNNYIYFGFQGVSGEEGSFSIRSNTTSPNTANKVNEINTYTKNRNLKQVIYNANSDGSTNEIYRNNVLQGLNVPSGSNDGDWFDTPATGTVINQIGGFDNGGTQLTYLSEIAAIAVFDEPLTNAERSEWYNYFTEAYFGSTTPLNFTTQVLTPVYEFDNSRYYWTGSQAKNPINGNIFSVTDRGDSHYEVNDFHDVVGQLSTDNGDSYGSFLDIVITDNTSSYTNPSIGYGSNGRLHCIYSKINFSGGTYNYDGLFFKYSDNDGTSWSTEAQVSGITQLIQNSNSIIIEGNDGNLYTTCYDHNIDNTDGFVRFLVSSDNGVTWGVKSNIFSESDWNAEPVNETSLSLLEDNTWLCMTRIQSRNYYIQSISTDNGVTWTQQGNTNFCDWWTNETTGQSSENVHLVRTSTFEVSGVKCVGCVYMNRGIEWQSIEDSYYRLIIARAEDLINYGVNGWADSANIELNVSGIGLVWKDGYTDIQFFDNNNLAYIRAFRDVSPAPVNNREDTKIQYFKYPINLSYIKTVLNIE